MDLVPANCKYSPMATPVVSREVESRQIAEFLGSVPAGPAALILEGEAGIGKTTVWLAALDHAEQLGYRVLSSRAAPAESVLAFSSLAALLETVDDSVLAGLATQQRLAIDRVLLRVSTDGPVTDQRATTAAFVRVVERLSEDSPVLLALDDLQWVDPPSMQVVSAAVRRLTGPVGLLATVRTGAGEPPVGLTLRAPGLVRHIGLGPLSPGALHSVLLGRLGRSFSRPKLLEIHQVSAGNPFYALELARTIDDESAHTATSLPATLEGLVRAKIGSLTPEVRQVLLTAACLPHPTVGLIRSALDTDPGRIVALLKEAEVKGIIEISGEQLHFTHPLLARGTYRDATPADRRAMHRRLAGIVDDPELKARHLALATTAGDPLTLQALDTGAELARIRGAPTAAAELLELAIGLGGDTPQRRISAAIHHFNAGDATRARALLNEVIARSESGPARSEALRLLGLWSLLDGSSRDAAELLGRALDEAGDDLALRVQILVPLAFAEVNSRRHDHAARSAEDAVTAAMQLPQGQLLSQALSMSVLVRFLLGDGLDESTLARALDFEDPELPMSSLLGPSVHSAALTAATGHLDKAAEQLLNIRQRYLESGEESELILVAFHNGLNEIWRGDFARATLIAEDAMERALLLERDLPLAVALMLRAAASSYTGAESDARRDSVEAIRICRRCDSPELVAVWPTTTLGFLDVTVGNYSAALATLQPRLLALQSTPKATEIFLAPFLPDAIEAMVHVGRLDDAGPLVELLESNGRRLDRAWMRAAGGRCRALLLAATGDIDAAVDVAQQALDQHDRVPMPFERARTELVLGQILRRQRKREAASRTLQNALASFEELGTPLWAQRAREDLQRASGTRRHDRLTASEQRVAELAATGATIREIAAALFISQKTVESNLSRIYRKLGIRSRAELGRVMSETAPTW